MEIPKTKKPRLNDNVSESQSDVPSDNLSSASTTSTMDSILVDPGISNPSISSVHLSRGSDVPSVDGKDQQRKREEEIEPPRCGEQTQEKKHPFPVWVTELPDTASECSVQEHFTRFGAISYVEFYAEQHYAIIHYLEESSATAAIHFVEREKDTFFENKRIRVFKRENLAEKEWLNPLPDDRYGRAFFREEGDEIPSRSLTVYDDL
eukprot:TRINITY_DN909_c0_g1_i2.p1 TRINITY_DN909_c0_g1~~TRINITY_DN909_c0_g1_i2.p1  ORF type:complete len:207 (-),score=53.08 TRINITY_DN909_c0_g1_i2:92-712(-)